MNNHALAALAVVIGTGAVVAEAGDPGASADEVRAIAAEVIADADARSSLLQGGGSGGWDDGFLLSSGDGAFELEVSGQLQFQFVANWNDRAGDDYDSDFVTRRTRLNVIGTVHDHWGYKFSGSFNRGTGTFIQDDTYISRSFENGLKLTAGQMKPPFTAEEINSSTRLVGPERSFTNEWFTMGRAQGVKLNGGEGRWRWGASFTDGSVVRSTRRNGEFINGLALGENNTDVALTGRAEVLLGEEASWRQFRDMSSASDAPFASRLGAAVHFQEGSDVGGAAEPTSLGYTADAWFEFGGASLQAWFVGMSIEDEAGVAGADSDQFAVGAQGNVHLVPDQWEAFGRWEYLDFDDALGAGRDDALTLLTVGIARYFHGHAVKWSTQVTYALDEVPDGTATVGLVTDGPGERGQVGLISQIQILF